MIRVNLIPQHKRARAEARRRRGAWAKFLRRYAGALAFACTLALLPAHAAPPSLESSISRANRSIEAATKSLNDVKRQAGELARQTEIARIVGDHPDWSRVLAAIADLGKGEAQLRSFDLSIAKVQDKSARPGAPTPDKPDKPAPAHNVAIVKLSGDAATLESCIKFVKSLEDLAVFDRVTVKDTRSEAIGQITATRFEIEATIDCGPIFAGKPDALAEKGGGK